MKSVIFIFVMFFLFTGCSNMADSYEESDVIIESRFNFESASSFEQDESLIDSFKSYPNLDENIKNNIIELSLLWKKFDDQKRDDTNQVETFHNSEYLAKFKMFLSKRESLGVSIDSLRYFLGQYGLESTEKNIRIEGKEFNIRVISYTADIYTQAVTDITDIKNKWIFVQCWNEDEFYFTTLSDGNIRAVSDFMPLEINNTLFIVLIGYSSPHYPMPPLLWAWRLDENGFQPGNLFSFDSMETDKWFVYSEVDFDNNPCKLKWTLHTDGALLIVEKRASTEESKMWPSDYLNVYCYVDEENKIFSFTSVNRDGTEESKIQLQLIDRVLKVR